MGDNYHGSDTISVTDSPDMNASSDVTQDTNVDAERKLSKKQRRARQRAAAGDADIAAENKRPGGVGLIFTETDIEGFPEL